MRRVPLSGKRGAGLFALVDDADFERVSAYSWNLFDADGTGSHLYARGVVNGKNELMHRFILGTPKGMYTDHRDGDGLNNTRANLRVATPAQNRRNGKPREGRRYKGLMRGRGIYYGRVTKEGRVFTSHGFRDKKTAALAYDNAARALFGEFARLNLPHIDARRYLPPSSESQAERADRERRTLLAAIAREVREGLAPKRIAKLYGVGLSRVLEACEAYYLRVPPEHRKPFRATTKESQEALRLLLATDLQLKEVGERVGLTGERVRQIRERAFLAGMLPVFAKPSPALSALSPQPRARSAA